MALGRLSGIIVLLLLLSLSGLMGSSLEAEVKRTSELNSEFCSKVYVSNISNTPQEKESLLVTGLGLNWNNVIDSNERVKLGYCAQKIELKELLPQEKGLVITQSLATHR